MAVWQSMVSLNLTHVVAFALGYGRIWISINSYFVDERLAAALHYAAVARITFGAFTTLNERVLARLAAPAKEPESSLK